MQNLVTRFHLLLLSVTVAMAGVGYFRIPADFAYVAHWVGNTADWLWPRDPALLAGPAVQVIMIAAFWLLGRALTKNHYAKSQHILDPALTLLLTVVAATQLGLLLTGVGSDLDFVRFSSIGLGAALLLLGFVLFEAERHTYAGLRMPWPIRGETGWRVVHRVAGVAYGLGGACLLLLAWLDAGLAIFTLGFVAALVLPAIVAGLTTLAFARH